MSMSGLPKETEILSVSLRMWIVPVYAFVKTHWYIQICAIEGI